MFFEHFSGLWRVEENGMSGLCQVFQNFFIFDEEGAEMICFLQKLVSTFSSA
jgi:hypothetical protein